MRSAVEQEPLVIRQQDAVPDRIPPSFQLPEPEQTLPTIVQEESKEELPEHERGETKENEIPLQPQVPEVDEDFDESEFVDVEEPAEEEVPLSPPEVPILQAQPEEEDDEDFNFGVSPEDLAQYSQLTTGFRNEEAKVDAGDFVEEEPVIFESKRERAKDKIKGLKQNLKESLEAPQEKDKELEDEELFSYLKESDGWNRRGKSEKTKAKEAKAKVGQSTLFEHMATQANTNPLEIVETSTGRADEEGVRQLKPEFLGEIEAIFQPKNPKASSPNVVQLRSSKSSLEKKKS